MTGAPVGSSGQHGGTLHAELVELERRGWDALSGPDGAAFYAEVMSEDGVMVFPGLVLDKARTVAAIRTERPWESYAIDDAEVRSLGADGGLVTYRATSRREGQDTYRALMTSVYRRRNGRWELVLHQQTPAPEPG